jgi:hypothetical protein
MPQILIVTDSPRSSGEVVYRERVASEDLRSSHFAGQLVERVGWAVGDAILLERRAELGRRDAAASGAPQPGAGEALGAA